MIKLEEAIDQIEFYLHQARHIPGTGRSIVEQDELLDLLDQLREALPEEVKQANWTLQEQSRLLSEAHAEAARIASRAAEQAEIMVSQQEVLRRAENQAKQIIAEAEARAQGIRQSADEYALRQMQQLEIQLSRVSGAVRKGLEALQTQVPGANVVQGGNTRE